MRIAKIFRTQDIYAIFARLENPRDRCIFALGIYTGLRIGEIIRLRQDQMFTEDGGIRQEAIVIRRKKKTVLACGIPIHPKLRQILEEYKCELPESEWLFPSKESRSGHLSRTAAHNILTRVFRTLHLKGASTHSMRRTCLTAMFSAGVLPSTVQAISGHSNLGQLRQYMNTEEAMDANQAIMQLQY